jgi:hypothetical protein
LDGDERELPTDAGIGVLPDGEIAYAAIRSLMR